MKKLITAIILASMLSSCYTSKPPYSFTEKTEEIGNNLQGDKDRNLNKRFAYQPMGEVYGKSNSYRFWVLFIPFGWKTEKKQIKQAHELAVNDAKKYEADGIYETKYNYKHLTIPFIVFTYEWKKVECEAEAYKLHLIDDKK